VAEGVEPREPGEPGDRVDDRRPSGRTGGGERSVPAGDPADGQAAEAADGVSPPALTRAARVRRLLGAAFSLLVALGMLALSVKFLE
jgi:hypothetical protein